MGALVCWWCLWGGSACSPHPPTSTTATPLRTHSQVDAQRARLPQTRAKGEYEMENTIKVLQHKEAKLSACRQSFKEHEALVYHQVWGWVCGCGVGAWGRGVVWGREVWVWIWEVCACRVVPMLACG